MLQSAMVVRRIAISDSQELLVQGGLKVVLSRSDSFSICCEIDLLAATASKLV